MADHPSTQNLEAVVPILCAFDIDGSLDAAPTVFLALMQALRAAGHRVVVITGTSEPTVTSQDLEDKATYLQNLGLGEAYDQLVVVADPVSEAKAEWLKNENADILIDNRKETARLAPCLALVPWATRE